MVDSDPFVFFETGFKLIGGCPVKNALLSIFFTLLLVSTLLLPITFAQDYTQLNLPEGANLRLGKGKIEEIQYSPDGTRLAAASSIGVWVL